MTAAKYRKKPVVIEAMRWDGTPESTGSIVQWCGGRYDHEAKASDHTDVCQWISIPTLEGVMKANVGDYVIRGVKGEIYPCKPDVFEATYEEADKAGLLAVELTPSMSAVVAERCRHEVLGWTAEHDRQVGVSELAVFARLRLERLHLWAPDDQREVLVKAASILLAAVDVLDANAAPGPTGVER